MLEALYIDLLIFAIYKGQTLHLSFSSWVTCYGKADAAVDMGTTAAAVATAAAARANRHSNGLGQERYVFRLMTSRNTCLVETVHAYAVLLDGNRFTYILQHRGTHEGVRGG